MIDPIASRLGAWSVDLNTWSVILRLMLSLLVGAVIGWERSSKRHSAGFRTFILALVSGCGVMILDVFIMEQYGNNFYLLSAAYLIAIANISIHSLSYTSRNEIRGLTTAVALWTAGLLGLLLGAGLYTVTLITVFILMCILSVFPILEAYLKNRSNHFEIHLELTNSIYLQDFVTTIRKLGLSIDQIEQNHAYTGSGLSVYSIAISISSEELKKYKTHREIIEALSSLEYIYYIEEMYV